MSTPGPRSPLLLRHASSYKPVDAEWAGMAKKQLKGKDPVKTLAWNTAEGINIKPIYTEKDLEGLQVDQLSGKYPYTRGPYPTM